MRDSNHTLRMNFKLFGFQTKVNQSALRERSVGFNVTAAQAEVAQFAMGNSLAGLRSNDAGSGLQPSLQLGREGLRQIQEANPGLPVGIGPGDLGTRFDFECPVRQLKAESQ